jgi:hypothetical protein
VRDHLSPEAIERRQLFDSAYVQQLIDEHERGVADHPLLIWGLVSIELWYREFVDVSPRRLVNGPLMPT